MAIGQKMTIKIHEDDLGAVVLDSVEIVPFNHNVGYVAATSVKKEDFTGSVNDAFTVQITAPSTAPISTGLTLAALTTLATDAVNAVYGNGEAGAPT